LPTEKQKTELKVTDRRIFTAAGDLREDFRREVKSPESSATPDKPQPKKPVERPAEQVPGERRSEHKGAPAETGERRRTIAEKASDPDTPFSAFIEPLIAQAYMSLGMLRNPYEPEAKIDAGAARQMIEILSLLKEKTRGNLTREEDDFLSTHVADLKLAYVQRTKTLS
jgi:hypothetical protein